MTWVTITPPAAMPEVEVVSTSSRIRPSGLSSVRVSVLVLVDCSVASDVADRQNEVAGFVDVVNLLLLLVKLLLVAAIGCTTNELAGHIIITVDNNVVITASRMVEEETMVVVEKSKPSTTTLEKYFLSSARSSAVVLREDGKGGDVRPFDR